MRNVVAYKRQYARIMHVTRAKEFMTKAAAPCSEFAWVAATVLLVLRLVFYGSCFVHGMRWDCILICYIWKWKRKWLPSLLRWEYLNDQFGCQILRHFEGKIWQNILLDDSAEFTILLSYEHMPNTLLINVISTVSNLSLYLHDLMNNG